MVAINIALSVRRRLRYYYYYYYYYFYYCYYYEEEEKDCATDSIWMILSSLPFFVLRWDSYRLRMAIRYGMSRHR